MSTSGSPGNVSALRLEVASAFAPDGLLAQAGQSFQPRAVQTGMADAVAQALEQRSVLVAEAGTGVGKTYAYLVPLLLSGRRALVSTATKSLQDQLFLRDLPRLCRTLGLPVQVALLKGRGSYLCQHRLDQARQVAELPDRYAVRLLARVEEWALTTRSGDLAELDVLDERSSLLPWITSSRDNCLGSECPKFRTCHVLQARREALQADVVVVNHHLFFADVALRDTGMAELLPTVDAVIFDEAHQLNEAGVSFLGRHLGSGQLLDFSRDLLAAGLAHARGLQSWQELAGACEMAARQLRLACAAALRGRCGCAGKSAPISPNLCTPWNRPAAPAWPAVMPCARWRVPRPISPSCRNASRPWPPAWLPLPARPSRVMCAGSTSA